MGLPSNETIKFLSQDIEPVTRNKREIKRLIEYLPNSFFKINWFAVINKIN